MAVVVAVLVAGLAASGLGAAPAPERRPTPRFVQITHEQGLSDDTVEAIAQDGRGFLWFGTQDGLNRYDGYSFTVYRHDPADPRSLSRSYVSALYTDRGGVLWVGTKAGLDRYDPDSDSFVHYLHDPEDPSTLSHGSVTSFFEDRAGDLWVGTHRGINRLRRDSGTFERFSPDAADPRHRVDATLVRTILEDRHGFLWIGTEGGGLLRMDREQGTSVRFRHDPDDPGSLAQDEVFDLLEDRQGRMWIATRGGLDRLDDPDGPFLHFRHDPDDPRSPGGDHLDDLLEDRYGQLWICYDGAGLDRFDEAEGAFVHFRHVASEPTSLAHDVVRTIYEDRRGDLWIGTYTGGISYLNQDHPFFYHRHRPGEPDGLLHNAVLSFFEDEDGGLWIGTEGGLNRYDPKTGAYRAWKHDEKDPGSLSADAVLSILRDRRGDLWVGTFFGGLNRMRPDGGGFVHYQPEAGDPGSLGNPHVWDVAEDRQGRLWLATFGGVDRLDPATGVFTHYRPDADDPESLASPFVWRVYEDRSGNLWMATNGGVSVYDPERDAFRTYGQESGLPQEDVLTLFEDEHGDLWLGLEGSGLVRFDPAGEVLAVAGTDGGLPSGIVHCILGDDRGLLWLSTSDGLSRFDPHFETIVNYDESHGVLAEPFSKNACLRSRSGELFFGGGMGFMSFFPETVKPDSELPPIVLTDLQVLNRPAQIGGPDAPLQRHVTEAERIRLRHDQSVMTIGYAALSYRAPHRNEYAYKLEGFDKQWNHVGGKRIATYTNLDPGRYVFRVKGSNSSGLWNEAGAAIEIVVEPPLWRTWWAYALYLLAASAIVLAFVGAHRRLRRLVVARTVELEERGRLLEERQRLIGALEARNDELRRFNYTLSHDLKSPLVTIKMFLGLARRDASAGDGERLRHDFGRIELAADTMYRQLEELYEFSRLDRINQPTEEISLSALIREILDDLAETIDEHRVEVVVDPALPTVRGDGTRLPEMLRELFDNAIEHFGGQVAPRIEVGVRQSDQTPVFFVRDNGVGIDPRYHERVFNLFERLNPEDSRGTGIGLAMVRRIVELHGGRVWVESEGEGRGSTFCFTLPGVPETAASKED